MQKEEKSGSIFDLEVIKRLFGFMKPYKGKFIFLVIIIIIAAVIAPISPLLVQYTIDNHIMKGDYIGLSKMMLIMLLILLFQGALQYSNAYLSGWLGQSIIRDIRIKLFDHTLQLRLKFYDNTPIGRLVTRTISDIESLSDVFTEGLAAMVGDILQISVILCVMIYIDWKLTLVSLSTIPLLLFSTYIFKEKIKQSFNEVRTAVANLNTFIQEHITGMSVVQIFNAEEKEFEKFKEINSEHRWSNIKSVLYYAVYFPIADIISAACIGLLVWYGTNEIFHANMDMNLGKLTAFIMWINMFFRPIRMIADRFNTLQMGIVSTDRIIKLIDNNEITPDLGQIKPENIKGFLEFKNVWFAYNEDKYVLKNISFQVNPGETLAIVGATGAGKSSIINLIGRLYEINQGSIFIDGVDLKEFNLGYLKSKIGIVLQDVFLFSGSIIQNITLGNLEITEEQVKIAARLVGADKFIEKLPGDYHYDVMERGATLSVGQRQMISFVRAMVYNPAIMILDEATSSVDNETEKLIQDAILKLMKGRTSIVIAHRLSTIQKADKIIVLDNGEIKEMGTHFELLKNDKGFYAQLHKMQYKELI